MTFRITRHSGFRAPADAFELLLQHLPPNPGARFAKVGPEIKVTWGEDAPVSMERDEREEIGRRAVLDIVRKTCDGAPELKAEWFAVSVLRR